MPSADGWGLRIGIFSRKFCKSSAKERAKVQVHFEGGWLVSFVQENAQSASICPEKGLGDASCMFARLSLGDRW